MSNVVKSLYELKQFNEEFGFWPNPTPQIPPLWGGVVINQWG